MTLLVNINNIYDKLRPQLGIITYKIGERYFNVIFNELT